MNLPRHVTTVRNEKGLSLHSYTDEAIHPSDASPWKGIVKSDDGIVARSFHWSPTHVVEDPDSLPLDLVYSPLYEATIIRFYYHNGECMVSTHSQIDIKDKRSRVGTGRPFIELINQAVSEWPHIEEDYEVRGDKYSAWTPESWQDLCQENTVQVFLLIDESNQITDLYGLEDVYQHEEGETVIKGPSLLHAMTMVNDNGYWYSYPSNGYILSNGAMAGYSHHSWIVPSVPTLSRDQAMNFIDDGGAVIGSNQFQAELTSKFLSVEYADKVDVAGETFNPIHRWHQLMDISEDMAEYYLDTVPRHKKGFTMEDMDAIHQEYLETTSSYLGDFAVMLLRRENIRLPPLLAKYKPTEDTTVLRAMRDIVSNLRDKYPSNRRPKRSVLDNEVHQLVTEFIMELPYEKQHALHGRVRKSNAGYI